MLQVTAKYFQVVWIRDIIRGNREDCRDCNEKDAMRNKSKGAGVGSHCNRQTKLLKLRAKSIQAGLQ